MNLKIHDECMVDISHVLVILSCSCHVMFSPCSCHALVTHLSCGQVLVMLLSPVVNCLTDNWTHVFTVSFRCV